MSDRKTASDSRIKGKEKKANRKPRREKNQKPLTVIFTWSDVHRFDFCRISLSSTSFPTREITVMSLLPWNQTRCHLLTAKAIAEKNFSCTANEQSRRPKSQATINTTYISNVLSSVE